MSKENRGCPYCLCAVEPADDKVRCPRCGAMHHADCWETNGKCSVYGCDGWAVWSGAIGEAIAPGAARGIEISAGDLDRAGAGEVLRCIECGDEVGPGDLVCWDCRRRSGPRWFESCLGPAALFLCGAGGAAAIMLRMLT